MKLELIETILRWMGAAAYLWWLVVAYAGVWSNRKQTAGRTTGAARKILRWPFYVLGLVVLAAVLYFLWIPIPIRFSPGLRIALLSAGSLFLFAGVAFYTWGRTTMGRMFGGSCGFGVKLFAGHELVTRGPFSIVRHPLYLGMFAALLGGLLLYHNWAMALLFLCSAGLPLRARREEQALEAEFGEDWKKYRQRVPSFIPGLVTKPSSPVPPLGGSPSSASSASPLSDNKNLKAGRDFLKGGRNDN